MTALVRKAASATEPGEITLDAQVISGAKTFNAAMTMGASVSTSVSGVAHVVNGGFNSGATGTADAAKRLTDTTDCIQIYTNLASDNDAASGVQIASAYQNGRWNFGRSDTTNIPSFINPLEHGIIRLLSR